MTGGGPEQRGPRAHAPRLAEVFGKKGGAPEDGSAPAGEGSTRGGRGSRRGSDIEDVNTFVLEEMEAVCYFGEVQLLSGAGDAKREVSVLALTFCSLFSLSKFNLLELLEAYPSVKRSMKEIANERARRYCTMRDASAALMTGLQFANKLSSQRDDKGRATAALQNGRRDRSPATPPRPDKAEGGCGRHVVTQAV